MSSLPTTYWISTKALLRYPMKYMGYILVLGADHTLVIGNLNSARKSITSTSLKFSLFSDMHVSNSVWVDDIVYVIMTIPDETYFLTINDKFRTAGMLQEIPKMNDKGLIDLTTYSITCVLGNDINSRQFHCIHSIAN